MTDVDELPAMWYCPSCRSWVGTRVDPCFECGTPRPRWPLLESDVDVNDSRRVELRDRLKAKAKRATGR